MIFNIKHSNIWPAIKFRKCFYLSKYFWKLLLIVLIINILVFFYGLTIGNFSIIFLKILLFLALWEMFFLTYFLLFKSFFIEKLSNPQTKISLKEFSERPERFNLFDFLSFEVTEAIFISYKFAKRKKLLFTSSVLLYILTKRKAYFLSFFFQRSLISQKELSKNLKDHFLKREDESQIYSKDLEKAIFEAIDIAKEKNHQKVWVTDLMVALSRVNPIFKNAIIKSAMRLEDVPDLVLWWEKIQEVIEKRRHIFSWENLSKKGSIGRDFAVGYTITLDKYGIDWTKSSRFWEEEAIAGHQEESEILERALANVRINNALLVGDPGSGRRTLLKRIVIKSREGKLVPELNYKRFVELSLSSLLSEIESIERVESTLDLIFYEVATAKNVILIIDNIHEYLSGIQKPGVVDISGILSKYLHLPEFQLIGITTYEGLHLYLEKNPSILSLFQKIEVSPLSPKETLLVLEVLCPEIEKKLGVFFSFAAMESIIDYANQYIPDTPFPKKAVDLADEVAVFVAKKERGKIILPDHVAHVVTEKTQIPVGGVRGKEREILLNLESLIHKRIINQDEAIKDIASALRRARENVSIRKGPMGSFLFLGPTGVGKTETAKALAEIYFGSESRIIRLDMSEFQNLEDISRIIGSENEEGLLTTRVREDPFSLVLLDEFEKAHPKILNLFLQVLDEGHLTDGLGRKVDFKNTIIIATSNAGYKVILEAIDKGIPMPEIKKKLMDYIYNQGIFRPELINRFDGVVVYRSLTQRNLLDIAELLMRKLKESLKEKEIEFVITDELKEKIVELSYNPIYGAREMRRVIQDKVGDAIARALLSGEIQKGDKIKIDPKTFKVIKISKVI